MKIASYIRTVTNQGYRGEARLYLLNEPVFDSRGKATKYVIVSAVDAFSAGIETFIFPADADGRIIDLVELDGSTRGVWDHELVLREAGFTINEIIDGELVPLLTAAIWEEK